MDSQEYKGENMKIRTQESFPASHFVQTADKDSPCRRLHGHTWKVIVEIQGKIEPNGMVVDFRDIKTLIKQLDHMTLVPKHLTIVDMHNSNNWSIYTGYNVLSIPKSDCFLLSIKAVTAENLANYFLKIMMEEMFVGNEITVQVWESENSYAEASSI